MSRATFEAFDGVEVTLIGGRVLNVPAFTLSEATAYVRMWSKITDGDARLITSFVDAFVERAGLEDATLAELGVEAEGCEDLTAREVGALVGALSRASWADDERERSAAQLEWLTLAPKTFGVEDRAELAALGQRLARDYYVAMYGLSSDFCSRLHLGPEMKAWVVLGHEKSKASTAGTPT